MRIKSNLVLAAVLLSVPAVFSQEATLVSESSPVQIDLSSAASIETYTPVFGSGVLLLRHRISFEDTEYSSYSRDGKLISRFRINVPDAQQTIGSRVAALRGGAGFVAVAIAVNGSERVATLCFLDRSGKLQRVVRTSPLWPYFVTVASDGTIWGFGARQSEDGEDHPDSNDPVLFHFSSSGELLGTALPRRTFGQDPPFERSKSLGHPTLASAGNRVVLYAPHTRQLFELALDRSIVGKYVIPLPDQWRRGQRISKPMGVAELSITGRGVIYAHLVGGDNSGLYELDRVRQSWIPLPGPLLERFRNFTLIGGDGDELALCPTGERAAQFPVSWIRLAPSRPAITGIP
jgi:hypothetical protein